MKFSRPYYWSGLQFPSPGDLPKPGINPWSLTLQADSYHLGHQGSPCHLMPPPKPFWVKNMIFKDALSIWTPARYTYVRVCSSVYFLKSQQYGFDFPTPLSLAFPYIHFESWEVSWRERASQTSNPFIRNLKLWLLSSIFWLHCYTKDKLTSGLRSLLWLLWDQCHFLGGGILHPSTLSCV